MANTAHAELIPVTQSTINNFETLTVNARELHSFLGVHRDFSNWIKGRIKKYGFVESVDFTRFANSGEPTSGGDNRSIDYILTVDMAKQLSMVENNAKGLQIRKYFIACEHRALEVAAQARDSFRLTSENEPRAIDTPTKVKDRKPLNALINTWVSLAPLSYRDAWQQVKTALGVESADGLTLSQIKPACDWVQSRIDMALYATVAPGPAAGKVPHDIIDVIMKASHQNLGYQKIISRLYVDVSRTLRELDSQLFEDWKKLDDCFMSLVA